jgi:hypothetical protein
MLRIHCLNPMLHGWFHPVKPLTARWHEGLTSCRDLGKDHLSLSTWHFSLGLEVPGRTYEPEFWVHLALRLSELCAIFCLFILENGVFHYFLQTNRQNFIANLC